MARKFLKRFFPAPSTIKDHPALQFLGTLLHDPNLFHLTRRSVSVAFFWGIFVAVLPIPGQMPVAALAALLARCNLPISVALVWITNPFTTPFFLFFTYHIGAFVLQTESIMIEPQFTLEWITTSLVKVWKPLLLGSVLGGIFLGALGYCTIRLYWRWQVAYSWNKRKKSRHD